jgi:hypothetical protein
MQESIPKEKIKYLINHWCVENNKPFNVRAFSLYINDDYRLWHNYLKGNTKVGAKAIFRLSAHFPNLNLNWLIKSEGNPFL